MRTKVIKNDIFHFNLQVWYGSREDIRKQMKKDMMPWDFDRYDFCSSIDAFFYYHKELDMGFLYLYNTSVDVIAHELMHTIFRMLDSRWIPIRLENDEVPAYLMSWYMREILKFLQPKKKTWKK